MFCPNCKAEYVEGIRECPDCSVGLVAELPPERDIDRPEFEKVLTIFNVGDIAVIRSVLDAGHIEYVFDGENFNLVEPMVQPATLFVKASQAKMAKELLKDMDLHYWSVSPRKTRKE